MNKSHPKKWIYALIAIIVMLSSSMNASIIHELTFQLDKMEFNNVEAPNGEKYVKIECDGWSLYGDLGAPAIPVRYVTLAIPMEATNPAISILEFKLKDSMRLKYQIYPIQSCQSVNDLGDYSFTDPLDASYESCNDIMCQIVSDTYLMGKYHHVTVAISPFTYDVVSDVLNIYEYIKFELSFEDGSEVKTFSESILKDSNGNTLNSYESLSSVGTLPIPKNYIIISEKSLIPSLEKLVVWKRQKGYNVSINSIEDILIEYPINQSTGIVDDAAALRSFLKERYSEIGSFFCFLVGNDRTNVPIRKLRKNDNETGNNGLFGGENFIPSDNYFADLSSEWNLLKSSTGYYTSKLEDAPYSPDIYIGRLLCTTEDEVNNYLEKLLLYESNPGYGENEYLNVSRYFVQYDGRNYYQAAMNNLSIFDDMQAFLDINISEAGKSGYPTGEMAIEEIGKAGYSSLIGHGEPSTIGCSGRRSESWKWEYISALESYAPIYDDNGNISNISPTNIKADRKNNGLDLLANDGRPSILYSISCTVTPFDIFQESVEGIKFDIPYNIGESFTVRGSNGGVAFLGNTRDGYFGPSDSLENSFGRFIQEVPKIGMAHTLSKYSFNWNIYSNIYKQVKNEHSLIGDPEFEMWLGKPKSMNINLEVSSILPSDSKMVCYDGLGNIATLTNSLTATPNFPTNFDKNDYMISVWKTGYLPYISYFGQNHTLKNRAKTFIVREAKLGSSVTTTKLAGPYTVGSGGKLTVKAIDSLTTTTGFIIEAGGEVELECNRTIYLNGGEIKAGGKLNTCSKELVMGSGFILNPGATITMSTPK